MDEDLKLLTEKEVSSLTGIPIKGLQQDRVYKRGMPYLKRGSHVYYQRPDIVAYLKKRKVAPIREEALIDIASRVLSEMQSEANGRVCGVIYLEHNHNKSREVICGMYNSDCESCLRDELKHALEETVFKDNWEVEEKMKFYEKECLWEERR